MKKRETQIQWQKKKPTNKWKIFQELVTISSCKILYENVLLVNTDAAAYMCKDTKALEVLYPKMNHV